MKTEYIMGNRAITKIVKEDGIYKWKVKFVMSYENEDDIQWDTFKKSTDIDTFQVQDRQTARDMFIRFNNEHVEVPEARERKYYVDDTVGVFTENGLYGYYDLNEHRWLDRAS